MKKLFYLFPLVFFGLAISCEKVKKAEAPAVPGFQTTPAPIETLKSEEPASLNVANVVLFPSGKDSILLSVEIARTPEEKRIGLQNRASLPDRHGMWFVFESDGQDPFWMHNTNIPLDILFVDQNYKVVDLVANTTPNSDTLIVSRQPYRYALEIKAGSADGYGLKVGDALEFRLGPP